MTHYREILRLGLNPDPPYSNDDRTTLPHILKDPAAEAPESGK